jgi:formiminotetrahydrofolate cyclodeaminase
LLRTSSLAFLEPWVLSLSPMINGGGFCTMSTAFSAELTRGVVNISYKFLNLGYFS